MSRIERLTQVGVEPIEIWDLLTADGDILWNRQHEPLVVAEVIARLREGSAVSRSSGPVTAATGVSSVFVTGGQLANRDLTDPLLTELRRLEMTVCCSPDAVFGAAAAAADILTDSLVIDVGQIQVKVVSAAGRAVWRRDLAVLPVSDTPIDAVVEMCRSEQQRRAFVEMVKDAIDALGERDRGPWGRVVIALPCSLEPDGAGGLDLGASSYIGMAKDHQRLRDLTALVPDATWRVLNDAELAVFAARQMWPNEPGALADDRHLVITFGFGVGGCVWDRNREVDR